MLGLLGPSREVFWTRKVFSFSGKIEFKGLDKKEKKVQVLLLLVRRCWWRRAKLLAAPPRPCRGAHRTILMRS